MNKFKLAAFGLSVLFVSLACVVSVPGSGVNPPPPTPVEASPSPVAISTSTPKPSVTPFPTPTRRPTSTEFATITPAEDPQASLTPDSFAEKIQGAEPTATNTAVKLAYWSPTPEALKCKVEVMAPAYGQDFKPRTDFMASWQLYNVGTSPWATGEFVFEYVSGDKLHNRDYVRELLSFTVYVKDRVKFEIHMRSPKEPGRYITTWGMRRTNHKEPFCTFSITIDVVK